jgi:serine kinase of HPr protein (carbohydrate metabolism regulator)
MQVKEIIEKLELRVYGESTGLNREISGGYTSDLLSDVMGHAEKGRVWITLQTHKNVMAVASLKELAAVILINDLEPEADMLAHAVEEQIPVLGTNLPAFESSARLYNLLNIDCEKL